MCGLFGILSTEYEPPEELVKACHALQRHRGPDGQGELRERLGRSRLLLGHQRLAIIDLSPAGRQPMEDAEGRGAIVFNGELYNYRDLRAELRAAGEHFGTASDTEVLLTALHHWGPAEALTRFNWMGAFAWLDRVGQRLVLARDPFGEKPIYVCRTAGTMLFASEVKTVLHLANRRFALNPAVLVDYLVHGLIDTTSASIFDGIVQLPAGHFLQVTGDQPEAGEPLAYFWAEAATERVPDDCDAFADLVRTLILDSVKLRLRADVPVGVLLSGGLDSSILAAAAVRHQESGAEVQLLSVVSDDPATDESHFIDRMAAHLNRPAIKVTLGFDPATVLDLLERVSWLNDHPVAYLGDLYHYLLIQRAREQGIIVILSGQGADELFCGYLKYPWLHLFALIRTGRPGAALRWAWQLQRSGWFAANSEPAEARRYLRQLMPSVGAALGPDLLGQRLQDLEPADLGVRGTDIAQRQVLDVTRLSVPSLCHSEDRLSMAWSCETRLPYLEPKLVRTMLAAPVEHKLRNGWTKYALRRAAEGLAPPEIAWRRDKRGFTVPEGQLLKGSMGNSIESYMTPDSLVFQRKLVDRDRWLTLFRAFRAGRSGASKISPRQLWAPWALEVWMRRYRNWLAILIGQVDLWLWMAL
jgi:asparagine synthase (glutamine-hydrolysing)